MSKSIAELRGELRQAELELEELVRSANSMQANLRKYTEMVVENGIVSLNKIYEEFVASCQHNADPSSFSFSNSIWENYQPNAETRLNEIRVGGLFEEDILSGEVRGDFPFIVPLIKNSGPIIIEHSKSSENEALNILQTLVLRSALLMPGLFRYTLLDPVGMGAAFPFRGFLGRETVRPAGRSTSDELNEILEDIRRINERVIGHANRFSELSDEQRSGETYELIAIPDFPKAYNKDPRAVESLVRIANAGPRAGRHLVICWNKDERLPHDFSMDTFANPIWLDLANGRLTADSLPSGDIQESLIQKAFEGSRRREGGDWNSIVRPDEFGIETSEKIISAPIGERLNFWLGESDDGKPSAHAMIAGQTGSGKSFFLHVLITGLASRYSPDELKMTLIDGKHGVEFEAYRMLPHADVVCLRTAPALARSVLADFVEEMEERYELFQNAGVAKLADYRAMTGRSLPRRILIVDEYQQILDGDPETGANLIGKLLEKGRAAGMHAVLGSQTFEQRGLPQSALTHIHTWASLSLSETYSQSLQVFGGEGKRLIRDLAGQGEVVLNDEGGRDGANSRGTVARLKTSDGEASLQTIVEEINQSYPSSQTQTVLSGRDGAILSDNPFLEKLAIERVTGDALQALARKPVRAGGFGIESWNSADRPIPFWLGRRFDVRGHALCALRRAPNQNLLVVGGQAEVRNRMLAASLVGIGAILAPDEIEFVHLDGLREDMPGGGMIAVGLQKLKEAGFSVREIPANDLSSELTSIEESIAKASTSSPSRLLVISEPDYLYELHGGSDRFSAPTNGPSVQLRNILSKGPQFGVHTVLSTSGLTSFQLVLSPSRESSFFNHRVVQQMNEDDSMSLFSSLTAARLNDRADHPFVSLYVDQVKGVRNGILFNSYCANRVLSSDQSIEALRSEINNISI